MQNDAIKTLLVATVLCVVCSVLVSSTAVLLKPAQEANKQLDVKKNLLLASGLIKSSATKEEINEAYSKIKVEIVNLETGEVVPDINPTEYDQEKARKDPEKNKSIAPEKDIAGLKTRAPYAPVYKLVKDDQLQMLILPVKGKGLWSTLYGFLALDSDLRTIRGLGFYSHAETPGLGGEVDNPNWKALWNGKKAFSDNYEDVKIRVVKGSVNSGSPDSEYKVDGLSGATITSNGVTHLLHYWLDEDGFGPYLSKLRNQMNVTADNSTAEGF